MYNTIVVSSRVKSIVEKGIGNIKEVLFRQEGLERVPFKEK